MREKTFGNYLWRYTVYAFILVSTGSANAICTGFTTNPITDVCWDCIFPIKIAGIPIGTSPPITSDSQDASNYPICICPAPPPKYYRIGINVSFYEPARYVEVVKDPYCFPSMATGTTKQDRGQAGSQVENPTDDLGSYFAQAHYFIFPIWAILELFEDNVCKDNEKFDLAYLTEVDSLWNDDEMSAMIHPEVYLFANPISQAACMVDAASCLIGVPIDALFWCLGTYGSAYPMTGHIRTDKIVQGAAAAAGKLTYKLARQLLLWDPAVNPCSSVPTPIWIKWHYRYQIVRPIVGTTCWPIGQTSLLWGYLKNPPTGGQSSADNFMFIIFRKRLCCASE